MVDAIAAASRSGTAVSGWRRRSNEAWNRIAWAEFLLGQGEFERARGLADTDATIGAEHRADGVERTAFEVLERVDASRPRVAEPTLSLA